MFVEGEIITNGYCTRKIIQKIENGYLWVYIDMPEKTFNSENSNDPFFEYKWKSITMI